MFRHFAQYEFRGHSPLYERLSEFVADHAELAAPLQAAPPKQRRAILYFAAVQYLLRTTAHGHPLSAYFPVFGGTRPADDALAGVLTDLATTYRAELADMCATRTTQTNEARRTALLRPGFGRVAATAGGGRLALVELGTSAGLLLAPDRYACRYVRADGRDRTYGPNGAAALLTMTCEVRGKGWPDPAGEPLAVAARVGVDLAPIEPTDPAGTDWLRSCIWPEHTDRLARLDAALAEVAAVRPRLVAGDMVDTLPDVLATVDEDTLPCVFASNALTYLGRDGRRKLVEVLTELGRNRDLALVLNEASSAGAELFVGRRPAEAGPRGVLAVGLLTVVTWQGGRGAVEVLARTGPHGQWLEWDPAEYAYAPAL
ncbi:MAG TPA: DUF2332 domain-containing protein [Micromonosporaceae bacterium]|nr:DUF2332 domain-containing protein [Micromonosporaceae bacterium]